MRKIKIAAGLSACDFGKIGEQVAEAVQAGVDYIHVDAQDTITHAAFASLIGGPKMVQGVRGYTDLPIEVHANVLGINNLLVDAYADAGANMLILPAEHYMGHKLAFLIQRIRERGMKTGLTVSPGAPLCLVDQSIYWADRLVVYTREAALKSGPLREPSLSVVKAAREMIDERKLDCELCCDGGISAENLHRVIAVGAEVLEFSREIFGKEEGITAATKRIQAAIAAAVKA